jgi:hypothetical protein
MIFDPLYFILLAPAMLLAMWAQFKVKSAYARAQQMPAPLSGAAAARHILDSAGLSNVEVEVTRGFLSDHYDPRHKVLRLSPEVYQSRTLAAVGIAAHEAGHAIQDARHYAPLIVRNAAVPLAATGGNISMFIFIIGMLMGGASTVTGTWMLIAGIALFSCVVFFQLVNLPVEFNASTRAKEVLAELQIVNAQEGVVVKKVLDAAAMTYVAATISAILTLIYFLLRSGLLGGRRG